MNTKRRGSLCQNALSTREHVEVIFFFYVDKAALQMFTISVSKYVGTYLISYLFVGILRIYSFIKA